MNNEHYNFENCYAREQRAKGKTEPLPVRPESAGSVCTWKKESFCMYFGDNKSCNYAGGCPHKQNKEITCRPDTERHED